jgi:hypothetical protein
MSLPAVGNTNVGLFATGSAIAEACGLEDTDDGTAGNQTTNVSLKGLCTGVSGSGATYSFESAGGSADNFDKYGGSNNPLQSTAGTDTTAADLLNIGSAPFHMSHCIGGQFEAGGGGPGR